MRRMSSPDPARRPRPRGDADTAAAILAAAEREFAARGFHEARIEDIVRAAGVSRGTFYNYFKDREDVFLALLDRVVGEMFALTADAVGATPEARVESGNRAYLEAFRAHRGFMRCVLQVATFHAGAADALARLRGRFRDRLRAHLERAQAAGLTHELDPAIASFGLVAMVEFTAYAWLSFGWNGTDEEFDFDAVVRELSALWRRAVYRD
jgi:AcrR family transcriptional regulator